MQIKKKHKKSQNKNKAYQIITAKANTVANVHKNYDNDKVC